MKCFMDLLWVFFLCNSHFELGFFLLALKFFKLEITFDILFCLKYMVVCAWSEGDITMIWLLANNCGWRCVRFRSFRMIIPEGFLCKRKYIVGSCDYCVAPSPWRMCSLVFLPHFGCSGGLCDLSCCLLKETNWVFLFPQPTFQTLCLYACFMPLLLFQYTGEWIKENPFSKFCWIIGPTVGFAIIVWYPYYLLTL
jgi:hypothetical protein